MRIVLGIERLFVHLQPIMNYRQQLNDILRLRLFFQTEQEMSQYIDYQLKGNHFNKFKSFQAEAYWSMFDRMCRRCSGNIYDLDNLIVSYEATSKFWYRHVSGRNIIADDRDLKDFVNASLLEQYSENIKPKVKALADNFNKQETIDMAILLLMTWGIIPSYTRKSQQDIADIKADFNKVYEMLRTLNLLICIKADNMFDELPALQELHYAIDKNCISELSPCRMTLIALTNKTLAQIITLKNRSVMVDSLREKHYEKLNIDGLWIAEGAAQDDTWVIMDNEGRGLYSLHHCTLDFKKKQIHCKLWQVCFFKSTIPKTYQTHITDRKFDYYNLLRSEMPTKFLHSDYTSMTFYPYPHENFVEKMCFHFNPLQGNSPLILNRPTENQLDYYYNLFENYEQIDDEGEFDVELSLIDTAISRGAIYMKIGGSTYKLDKFRDGKETIEGVCKLSFGDNFFLAKIKVDGNVRQYIFMESINFSMSIEDFLERCVCCK